MIALWLALFAYVLIPAVFGAILFRLKVKSWKARLPQKFVLLRGPGETLRRKIAGMDEDLPLGLMMRCVAPLVVGGGVLWLILRYGKAHVLAGMAIFAGVLVLGMAVNIWWIYRWFHQRRRNLLGYLGERAVGEELEPLRAEGYRVFHDVPGDGGDFNLDHVVVGPTGLFVVETKTRSKGRAREGYEEHKVFYDGCKLIWPWGEDEHGLKQARNEADWLEKWLKRMTGMSLVAKPVLALPGWWVETRSLGPVAVHNPRNLPSYIRGKGERVLDAGQIELIARQLDARCRDVED